MDVTMENLAKWIDELAGEIEILKRKAGGGSSVTITPELESGVKIADYTIGSTEGSLYAPEGGNELDFSAPMKIGTLGTDEVYLARAVRTTKTGTNASFTVSAGVTGVKELMFASMIGLVGVDSQYFVGMWQSIPFLPTSVDGIYTANGFRFNATASEFSANTNSGVSFDKVVVLFVYTKAAPTQQTKKTTKKK